MSDRYSYRILLEFNTDVSGVSSELVDSFKVIGEEYEYIGGKLQPIEYPIINVITPTPITSDNTIDTDNGKCTNVVVTNGILSLEPLEVNE